MGLIRTTEHRSAYRPVVGPGHHGLRWLSFGLLRLADGDSFEQADAACERVFVVLGGRCDMRAGDREWRGVGERPEVFAGRAAALYAPPGCPVQVTARGPVEIAVCGAMAEDGPPPTLIRPDLIRVRKVGTGAFAREVHDIVTPDTFPAGRLLVGETFNLPGCWSSYPPHKHDREDPPRERALEEVFYFRVQPTQGFGLQRVYGEGAEECRVVQDGDVSVMIRGYHPVVAAPGYRLYYLWALAGETRELVWREDPAHEWVTAAADREQPAEAAGRD